MAHRSLRPLPLGWLRLFDCPFGGLTPGGRRGAFLGEARLQRVHQIDDLGLRRFLRLGGDLLAVHLLLDGGEDAVPHLIVILLGVELVRGRLLDQLLGQRELGRLYGHLRNRDVFRAPDLVGVVQLLHRQHTVNRTDQHQVLLAPGGILAHGRAPGFLQRLGEELVGSLAALVRTEIIGPVEVDPVHLRERHELSDVDGFGGLLVQGLELLWREEHVLALGELVALGHVVPLDDLVVLGTDVLLLEAGAALLVQQVEAPRGGRLARGKEGDGDRDEPEGDGGGGDRAGWHRTETIGRFRRPRNRAACLPFTVYRSPYFNALPPSESPSPLSGQALPPANAGARRHRRPRARGGGAPVRGPQARRTAAPLRPPARDGGRAAFVGRAQGAVVRPGRQAARGARRGSSDRVRRLRGAHPRGELRCRRRDRLGSRAVGAPRRSDGRPGEGQAAVRAARLQAARHVDPGEAQEERARLAPHQGARPVRSQSRDRFSRGV